MRLEEIVDGVTDAKPPRRVSLLLVTVVGLLLVTVLAVAGFWPQVLAIAKVAIK